jgi:hypothetical protein
VRWCEVPGGPLLAGASDDVTLDAQTEDCQ